MIIGFGFLGLMGCEDENLSPVLTFDNAGKGAYVRLVEETPRFIDFFDIQNSVYTYSIEFVDVNQGQDVQSYDLQLLYDAAEGEDVGPVNFLSFSAADFVDMPSGFKGLQDIQIRPSDLFAAAGIAESDVAIFDEFQIIGTITTSDGQIFGQDNSTSSVTGTSFAGHFNFTRTVSCSSDLGGTYDAIGSMISTDGCCPDEVTSSAVVTLTDEGGGVYNISDFSAGTYLTNYDVYGVSAATDLSTSGFIDVCNVIQGSGTEVFGAGVEFTGAVDPATGVITFSWVNGFGDTGEVTMTPR